MSVLVDTPVWSLALRRQAKHLNAKQRAARHQLLDLIARDTVVMIGPIRQELLSGIREHSSFERLRDHLRAFDDLVLTSRDFEEAAAASNQCRSAGIAGSLIDFLICAVEIQRGFRNPYAGCRFPEIREALADRAPRTESAEVLTGLATADVRAIIGVRLILHADDVLDRGAGQPVHIVEDARQAAATPFRPSSVIQVTELFEVQTKSVETPSSGNHGASGADQLQ